MELEKNRIVYGSSNLCFVSGGVVPLRLRCSSGRQLAVGRRRCSVQLSAETIDDEQRDTDSRTAKWKAEGDFALKAAFANIAAGLLIPALAASYQAGSLEEFITLMSTRYVSHYELLALLLAFGTAHSGLASLRATVTEVIGERLYRVGFAFVSIPWAVLNIGFFIAHRYDGMQLWRIQGVPGAPEAVWISAALSFYLLYPATFNLLEIAAVQKPTFRIYETGIMRITRHPQLWGQVLWCICHSAWIGTTMPLVASAGLLAHHFLGAWNGDRRLRLKYGKEWEEYAERTSLLPFEAVLDGRQKLDIREFLKPAYIGVTAFILGLSKAHPIMLRAKEIIPF
ncbi:hypothetical protein NDN08_004729 [Rhodosorus marinus]|uniref:NnrU domain-containing protein n=1 Tax=Rhodosorus marinus TaxID=101924 RepID=A0AAV8UR60_9RHOD|nr:hypothetical protein NDN08_004729 [Rhodosorus marinus]